MKRKVVRTLFFVVTLLLGLAALVPAINSGNPQNPSLFELRYQASQIAAFFPVDPDLARQWVPPEWDLALDAQGNATGVLTLIHFPSYCLLSTPNSPPLKEGENIAPASVAHFWLLLQGPTEVLPVPGSMVTSPTAYYYDVADLVTSPVAHRVFRRAGRPAILVSDITLVDQETTQTGIVTFFDGSKISLNAIAPPPRLTPLKLGGNVWQWHVGGFEKMGDDLGVRLDPTTGHPSNVNTTRVQFLALVPGPPNMTQVTIHADPGTGFADVFGMSDVVASRATFFRLTNIALNGSRGDLAWTTYPSPPIPVPPALP
jgi:hypothetical protein